MRFRGLSELPSAFICFNDRLAGGAIEAIHEKGLKIPEDIGVTGFDDTPLCEKANPQITTVQVQKELMGQVAVSNLMDRIHRKENTPMTQLLSVKIVERASLKL